MTTSTSMIDITVNGLSDLANAEVVVAKPIDVDGKQIIPVLALSVGFFGAGGNAEGEGSQPRHQGQKRSGGKGKGKGAGSGAVGSAKLVPIAVVIRDGSGVRVMRVPKQKKGLEKLMDQIPGLVKKIQKIQKS
jgi:uncharacterized spore protein YtfJ